MVIDHALQELLVGAGNGAAVDLPANPAVAEAAETFAKAAAVARRVAKHHPDDDGVFIRQRTFGNLPHPVVDFEASSNSSRMIFPLLCSPAKASVLCSLRE